MKDPYKVVGPLPMTGWFAVADGNNLVLTSFKRKDAAEDVCRAVNLAHAEGHTAGYLDGYAAGISEGAQTTLTLALQALAR